MVKPEWSLLEALFRAHASTLRASVRRRVGAEEADDIVQEAYLRTLQQTETGTLEKPGAFLFRVAMNLSIDSWRRTKARSGLVDPPVDLDFSEDPVPGPEAVVAGKQRWDIFVAALAELPEPCQHAFILNKFEGKTHAEIATQLGISDKTVARYINRAFEHCAQRLVAGV